MDCDVDGGPSCGSASLGFDSAVLQANPNDVLSAEFVTATHGAQSLAVLYALSIDGGTGATPTFAVVDGGQVLPILGLYPATDYDMQAIASDGVGGIARSPVTHFTTQTLPAIVDESFTVTSNGAYQPGYVLLTKLPVNPVNTQTAGMVVDRTGRVAWYEAGPTSLYGDFEKQANGTYTLGCFTPAFTFEAAITATYLVVDPLGDQLAYYTVPDNDGGTDNHEFTMLPDNTVLMIGETGRTVDTSQLADGGSPDTLVVEQTLWRIQLDGGVQFHWDAFDHTHLGDLDPVFGNRANNPLDATHLNAFSLAPDGNYIASLRQMDEVVKIDSTSGDILWTLGGAGSNFTFVNDPLNGFSGQHYAHEIAPNDVLLYDDGNNHVPPTSRAVEYQLSFFSDGGPDAATMVWSYTPPAQPSGSPQFGFAMGSAQRLPNGDTLVAYGTISEVDEIDPNGNVVWSLVDNRPGFGFYRAIWIDTLY